MPDAGLLYVVSKVESPPRPSDELYNCFYNAEHIPYVPKLYRETGGRAKPLALRYKNVRRDFDKPELALFPVPDAQWLFSCAQTEFQSQVRKSSVLGVDNAWDHTDFDFRPYRQIQTFEGYKQASKTGLARGKTLIAVAMEPATDQEEDFEDWYRKQHLDMLSMCCGDRRSTRYKRMDDRSEIKVPRTTRIRLRAERSACGADCTGNGYGVDAEDIRGESDF